jgi:D-galactarolactone cycloisomerase
MHIASIEALIIRIPGHWSRPGRLTGRQVQDVYPGARGDDLQTVLARVGTNTGLTGWGESQALFAPEVTGAIIQGILKPTLEGKTFSGEGLEIETLWNEMYNRLRTCGQTGGFMMDAIAAVDIALWDLAGQIHRAPIARLIAGAAARSELETYVNHLPGETIAQRVECAHAYAEGGATRFKIFHRSSRADLFEEYDALAALCGPHNIAVDALWGLDAAKAQTFAAELDRRGALWLECPFAPEDPAPHAALAARCRTPIAIGETYRTHYELAPFFRAKAMRIVQPDVGRCGITETLRIARAAERAGMEVVPHLTPAVGPLLFATLQVAAAIPNCRFVPHTPELVETPGGFTQEPAAFANGRYQVPQAPGLGVVLNEAEVRQMAPA